MNVDKNHHQSTLLLHPKNHFLVEIEFEREKTMTKDVILFSGVSNDEEYVFSFHIYSILSGPEKGGINIII